MPLDLLKRQDEFEEEVFESFEERVQSSIQLWRPGTLWKYAWTFSEEEVQLWAIEPEVDDPQRITSLYSNAGWSKQDGFVQENARIWLLYTDSTCWEIFARKEIYLNRVRESVLGKPWVDVFGSDSTQRGRAFSMAGLSETWQAMNG